MTPSIAKLVERWTVVVLHQKSIGRWFKSGSKDFWGGCGSSIFLEKHYRGQHKLLLVFMCAATYNFSVKTMNYHHRNRPDSLNLRQCHPILDSLVVRISACHVEGPGSIPGRGESFLPL